MVIKKYFDIPGFVAGITMRDENDPEDSNMALHTCQNPGDIIKNREKLAHSLGCSLEDFVCCNQTHSHNFSKVSVSHKGLGARSPKTAIKNTDALYTFEPGIVLCSFTADCVPLVFYDEKTGVVGVVHSGWQGTVKEIASKVFKHLLDAEHCNPGDFNVYIGPAIGQGRFEVDEDVYLKFRNLNYGERNIYYNNETNKYHIDNKGFVREQCLRSGIDPAKIIIDTSCTYEDPCCFSYRRDRDCGRHMSFVMRLGLQ